MKYVIDTHILIWFIEGKGQLSKNAIALIVDPTNEIYISQGNR
ncbi:MAG: hypothetical protein SVX43_06865 [Cyanobacteriota bacterium]|nr:hypothetical protein [Cyanobacteriota bacterium]